MTRTETTNSRISVIILFLLLVLFCLNREANGEIYIRVNQVGFAPYTAKTAVIIATADYSGAPFQIVQTNGEIVYEGLLSADAGYFGRFSHHHLADFSALSKNGKYVLKFGNNRSPVFEVKPYVYKALVDSLLRFFEVQRCGRGGSRYHSDCHLEDAARIVGGPDNGKKIDVAGGWHDAGDYIKFVITTSYAVHMLLLAYEFCPELKNHRDNEPSLLNEIRIGLDWLMKMHYQPDRLLIQVQDGKDHSIGWRLPENDPLSPDRPAYHLPSRAHCGSFTAAMALGSAVFMKAGDKKYSKRLLRHAIDAYALARTAIPPVSVGPDSMYYDQNSWDNIALAAVELYRSTGEKEYLGDAKAFLKDREIVHWLSWGDVAALAYARLGDDFPEGFARLRESLAYFDSLAHMNPFGYPLETFPWGSAATQLGVATIAILYSSNTDRKEYLPLAARQRDFLLGNNSHGVSLISGFGTVYPRNFHHQVAYLKKIHLPGAVAGGFISKKTFSETGIRLGYSDRFLRFQSNEAVFYDDRNDYLTNEPTIVANAQALFVYAWFMRSRR